MKTLFDEPQNEHEESAKPKPKELSDEEIHCVIIDLIAKNYDLLDIKRLLLAKSIRNPNRFIQTALLLIKNGYNSELASIASETYVLSIRTLVKEAFKLKKLDTALNGLKEICRFSALDNNEQNESTKNVLKIQIIE